MKNRATPGAVIENRFQAQVQKAEVKNAYLLVHSDKTDLHVRLAAGTTGDTPAHPDQPNYMASVGKLFTSTLVGIMVEQGKLSFDDSIAYYLDQELLEGLHVFKGRDYSSEIKIKHLLNQTSGLPDNFRPLLEKLLGDHELNCTPREAVAWTKDHLTPHAPPGRALRYTDTNYHLLGLIVEKITREPFHAALRKYIFEPLDMRYTYMLHYSEPMEASEHPTAEFYYKGTRLNDIKGYAALDYAGGGVVGPSEDLLKFMKALAGYRVVGKNTLDQMLNDRGKLLAGFKYGYGIWQPMTIPLLMPKTIKSWGVVGATGAFMFYHPQMDVYAIGNFNDFACERKGVQFVLKLFHQMSKVVAHG